MTYVGNDKYEIYHNNEIIIISIEEAKEILLSMVQHENRSSFSNYTGIKNFYVEDLAKHSKITKEYPLENISDANKDMIDTFLEEATYLQEADLDDKYILIER